MHHPHLTTVLQGRLADPSVASRISQNHRLSPRFLNVRPLAIKQPPRHLRLGEIVRARRSATQVRFFKLDELDARHRLDQISWTFADPLAVGKVAGVMIGNRAFPSCGGEIEARDRLAQVHRLHPALLQPAAAARLAAAAGFVPAVQGATDEPALAATWSEEPRLSVPRDAIAEATDSVFSTTYLVGPWRQVRSAWTRLCEAMTSPDVDLTQAVADMLDEVNNVIDAYEMARIASPVAESSVPIDLEVRCDTGDEVAGVWVQTAISSSGFAEPAGDGHFRFTLDSGGPFVVHVGCGEADGRWLAVGWSPILEGTTGEIVCSGDRSQLPGSCRVA